MATPNQIKSLTALYIGYFDRAPDPAGLQFWIDQLNNGREFATIAQDFATSPEAKAIYPFLANPGVASAESFIANVYNNLFDRAPDAAGLAFWSGVLESGSVPVGDMIAAIIEGAQGADKALVDNLTEVALDWTETVAGTRGFEWNEDAAAASRDILAGVTADDATVVAAQDMTDTYAATFGPQPFTLSVEGGAVMEGNAGAKSLSFVLTLGSQPTSDVVVNYKTLTSGTATQDDDFSASMGSVTFKAGEMQKIVTVSVLGDSVVEGNETVNVLFSGARLTAPVTASGTIVNDDNTPIGAVRDVTAAANIVSEAAPVGATVGLRAQATDVDAGSAVIYSLDDDADGLFTINAVTGTVTLAAPVDYEQATSHAITVRATSSDGTFSVQDFTVAVTNANDNALTLVADVNAAANVVAETAVEGSVVGITALATDADAGATVRYALTDNAGGRFAIHAETGVVTVAKAGEFDFEAAQSHDITVTATSSDGAVTTQVMTIAVTDMPDPVQVLTTGTDTLSLGRQDNLIVGSNGHHGNTTTATYNSSDIIDGGAGTDTLQLELSSNGYFDGDDLYDFAMSGASQLEVVNLRDYNGDGYTAASPVVRNVEILDVNIDSNVYIYDEESLVDFPLDFDFSFLASVIVDMSRFDTALEQINLVDTEGSVFILDQQSVADVLIRDTNGSVYLDYDSQVVGNTGGHQVNVTIDEFGHNFTVGGGAGGVGSSFKPALVVNDVPTIVLNVADGIGENSAFVLASQGANTPNQVGITGGIASQGVVIDTHLNVGSSVYATSFAGDLYLANDGGGDVKDVYTIDFNNVAAGVTTSMTLVADGVTHTVGFTASETMTADEVKAEIARLANEVVTWKEIGFVVETGVGGRLGLESSVSNLVSVSGSQAGDSVNVTEQPETVDVSSELRTVSLGAGDDELLIFSGDVTRRDRIDLGEGDNTMSLMDGDPAGGNVFGTVSAGDGDDDIQVTHLIGGAVVLGGGTNTVGAQGITGTLTTGAGDDVLRTEFIGHVEFNENFGATVDLGDGNNVVDVTGAGIGDGATLTTGAGNDELTIGDGLLSGNAQVDLGDGTNRVVISGIEDNAHLAFGDGDANEVNTGSIAGNENRVSITFGDGDHNALFVGGDIGSSVHRGDITFGDGDGQYFASGTVTDSSITMGDGDNNGIGIYGDFTGFGATTINLGNGDNSSVYIAGAMIDETINGGTGDNTTIMIGEDVVGSTLNLAGGDTVLSISGSVGHGSSITMSDEADLLGMSEVHSSGTQTVVALNGGDDTVVLYNTDGDGEDGLIQSGAVVQGGEGDDTLVVMADEDTDVVARSKAQVVTIRVQANDATGNFAVGNAASVVIAGVVYTYVVKASDIVQGDGAATALNVAIGLETALDASPMESVVRVGSEITLTGVTGDADLAISAETDGAGSVEAEVVQIADVAITGFETLDLHTAYDTYAVSGYEGGAENFEVMFQNGGEDDDGNVRADFDFIDGVETVNMTSHSALTTVTHSADTPGQYEANAVGRTVMFDLDNLDGGETLIVSGDEVTATGNQAVYRFTVTAIDDANQIGDVLTATVNGIAYSITVTEDDLATSDAATDAARIAQRLADAIDAEGVTVGVVGSSVTLIGSDNESIDVEIAHERPVVVDLIAEIDDTVTGEDVGDLLAGGGLPLSYLDPDFAQVGDVVTITMGDTVVTHVLTEQDFINLANCLGLADTLAVIEGLFGDAATLDDGVITIEGATSVSFTRLSHQELGLTKGLLQEATAADDTEIDVYVRAALGAEATDTVMDLTIAGRGDFDLALELDDEGDSAFTDLALTLGDTHSHYVNTGGGAFSVVSNFLDLGYTESDFENLTTGVVEVVTLYGEVYRVGPAIDVSEVSYDGGESFEEWDPAPGEYYMFFGDFAAWLLGQENSGEIASARIFDGHPEEDGTLIVETVSVVSSVGGFENSITVTDAEGVDPSGASIILDNVFAKTVTSTSTANLVIDQASVWEDLGWMADEGYEIAPINVTTGSGDDHLITLAQAAMAEGASIDLGTGTNTLSLVFGEDVVVDSFVNGIAVAEASEGEGATDLGDIDEVEEDGTKAFALTVGERVTGTIAADGDRDVFAVDVVAGQTYQFSVHSAGDDRSLDDGEVGDVKLRVYDEDFNRLDGVFEDNDEDSFGDEYLGEARVFTADRTGVMYFEVEGYYDDFEDVYNSGSYSVEVTEAGTKLLAGLNYNGDLNRLEILDDIEFVDGAIATLDVPGGTGQVSELYFEDIWADDDEAIAAIKVRGTASTLLVESGDDIGEADDEQIVFEAVGVTDLTFDIDDDLGLTLRGAELETFTATIEDNAYVEIDGDLTPNLSDINVAAEDNLAMDVDNLHTGANVVAHANSDDGSSGDVNVSVENSTLGNILALYGADEDTGYISFRGDVTVGDIALLANAEEGYEAAQGTVQARFNTGSSIVVGNVENFGFDTELLLDFNNDSTLVFGDIMQTAEDDATFKVLFNNVVDITTGDVSLVGDDADFEVDYNGRPSEAFDGDDGFAGTSLTFGTVDLLALSDTELSFSVSGNRDDVFYANTEITMDGVNLRSVGDVLVEIGDSEVSEDLSGGFDGASNVSTDISLGDINAEACNEVYVVVSGNSGTHYPVTAGVIPNAFTDFARVIAGDMSLFSHDEYVDLYVHGNDRAEIKLAAEAGQKLVLGSRSDYAHVSLSNNFDTLIEVGELEVNGVFDTGVDFFGNVTTERDGPSMEIFTAGMSISGVGEDRGAHLIINENEYIEMTVNGDIDVSGGSYEVYLEVQENDGSDVHVNGSVELTGDGIVSALIDDNDDAEVLIADGVSVDGGQAFFDIQNNDDSVVRFGGLSALGETQAYLSVGNNYYSTVELFDDVALEAIERDADGTAISGGSVSLSVEDNKEGSDIAVGYDYDTETFKSVDIEAWLGASVRVQYNDGTRVHLGNLDIVSHTDAASFTLNAAPRDVDGDGEDSENETTVGTIDMKGEAVALFTIDVENPLDGEDGEPVVVVDDVTIDSGFGVNFYVYNEDAETVTLGDIDVDAGLGSTDGAFVSFEVENTDGTESVDLDVSNSASSNLSVTIDTMSDLNSLTLAGSTGNVSLSGDLGGDEDTGGFLLDLGGMTGSFSGDLDDLGGWSRNYNGSHVDTWDAEFEGTVTVEIGSGDLVYNAEVVTTDGEDTENSLEEQWTETGWVSRNSADITPVVAVQWIGDDVSYPEYPADQPDGEDDSNFNTVQFEQDGVSYRVQLTSKASDGEDGGDDPDTQSQELKFASYADSGWQLFEDEDDFLAALGIDSVEVSGGQIKFYGPADGSGFLELSDAKLVYEDSGAVEKSLSLGKSDGDAAVDGIGQEEREIFQFVGDEIGNVVIGGFNADPFDTAFGRATDRLDFSGFAGVNGLDDLTFAIDDSDGFFADVIVDFVNDSYGEIRLVGVGELENAIDAVSGSIIF